MSTPCLTTTYAFQAIALVSSPDNFSNIDIAIVPIDWYSFTDIVTKTI